MIESPSTNGSNGRKANGRFASGWKGGPGNPHAARVQKIRAAILDAATKDDIKEVVRALIEKAKQGDVAAIKLFLDRVAGPVKDEPGKGLDTEIKFASLGL